NSKSAQELAIKINNQEAVVKSTQKQLKNYVSQLNEMTARTVDTRSNLEKLEDTISDQENELKNLEREYQNAVITFGENSQEVKNLKQSYQEVSQSLEENRNSIANINSDQEKLKEATEKFKKSQDDVSNSTSILSDGYSMAKDVIADFIKDGIQWALDKFKELMSAQDEAMKSFQAQTGMATEDMSAYNDEMQELYKQGYGENLTDIANAMAQVKQTTNELDPSKLGEMTKNALLLGETYEFDIAESLRAVNMLTDQFGITSQEAYNLIVQGCQNGLNKNGDLLDVINEYSVHYAQMGNTAEDFFNSLLNGTEAGAFSVDKLGDGYKEFGIRTREVNDDVKNAYASLGLITVDNTEKINEFIETIAEQESKVAELKYSLEKAKL
ncbi:MAG: phage tail tape measure protein, partial [Ruminococcus sp.]|nr:phage tail tape measure protein [Ruminococcus sp.]